MMNEIDNNKEELYNPKKSKNSLNMLRRNTDYDKSNQQTKTQIVSNDELEKDFIKPVITAGVEAKDRPLTDDEKKRLELRKKLELELIKQFDKNTTTHLECWFIIDSAWLNQWSTFVSSTDDVQYEAPGPVSSKNLLDENNKPLDDLKVRIDYRGVPPLVFYIFTNLYGKDESPELPRYTVDIYGPTVEVPLLVKVQYAAKVYYSFTNNIVCTKYTMPYYTTLYFI